jgi:hypothetical protein
VNAGIDIDTANALLRGGAVRQGDGNNDVMAGLSDYDPEVSVLQQYVLETRQEQDDCARKMRALEAQHAIDMEVFSGFHPMMLTPANPVIEPKPRLLVFLKRLFSQYFHSIELISGWCGGQGWKSRGVKSKSCPRFQEGFSITRRR